jgi:hypothetical protein
MRECKCPNCVSDPLPTYLPSWRLECEARELMKWPVSKRLAFLDKIAPSRAKVLRMLFTHMPVTTDSNASKKNGKPDSGEESMDLFSMGE